MFDDGYVSMNSVHGDYSGILHLAHLRRHRWNGRSDKQLSTGHCAAENADVGDQGATLSHHHVDYRENLHVSVARYLKQKCSCNSGITNYQN